MNLFEKLVEVRKVVPYLQKESKSNQYNYVGSSQVLGAVRKKLDELGVLLTTKIINHELHTDSQEKQPGKITNTYFTELDLVFTWINAEKPEETYEIPFYGQGVDIAGEKGVGKALTYAEKYFMLKQFNIATDKDDPDRFQEKAQTYSKDLASQEQIITFQNKAKEYCDIKGQGTPQQIYASFKITNFNELTSKDIQGLTNKLDIHIANAVKELAENETK